MQINSNYCFYHRCLLRIKLNCLRIEQNSLHPIPKGKGVLTRGLIDEIVVKCLAAQIIQCLSSIWVLLKYSTECNLQINFEFE